MRFIVNSVNNVGSGIIAVNLAHVADDFKSDDPSSSQAVIGPNGGYLPPSTLVVTLPFEEAKTYFPGQIYTLELKPEE